VGHLKKEYMTANSNFESRTGKLSCAPETVFNFITDIRNFEQFIPPGNIQNWQATAENCNFQVPPVGSATIRISEKTPFSSVIYSGDALQKNDFTLFVHISEDDKDLANVRLSLEADLNPFLKMMASGPIEKFLEMLISEMEKFEMWNNPSKES
jgi:carbon monoxide dehydrogenase subunit G